MDEVNKKFGKRDSTRKRKEFFRGRFLVSISPSALKNFPTF
jgi:hypothetical protein